MCFRTSIYLNASDPPTFAVPNRTVVSVLILSCTCGRLPPTCNTIQQAVERLSWNMMEHGWLNQKCTRHSKHWWSSTAVADFMAGCSLWMSHFHFASAWGVEWERCLGRSHWRLCARPPVSNQFHAAALHLGYQKSWSHFEGCANSPCKSRWLANVVNTIEAIYRIINIIDTDLF